ncbi:MAG TPA: flagellar hook capping FlgD N-terminal domain-containing protein [Paracoccaceae bacterium]|nr:flagellar hook capping FlgD N-terminal domain-containing protein [Paracoccaceae bacterium]HMO72936.1 flagellar hook capping FlgD N-terminal domain-containing protein [Paracoccaceae bacterium]
MDIAAATAATTAPAPAPAPAGSKPRIASDFDTFLRMLTVQMRNQDPLNPIDSADYAVQLATFSGVEQQIRTNQTMDKLLAKFDLVGMAQMAGWVGNEARVAAPVAFSGEAVPIEVLPDALADRVVLSVRDARGALVGREDLAPGAGIRLWHGLGATGAVLPPGLYTLEVESWQGETRLGASTPQHYARIDEVQSDAGTLRLVLAGGATVAADAVTALRRPG